MPPYDPPPHSVNMRPICYQPAILYECAIDMLRPPQFATCMLHLPGICYQCLAKKLPINNATNMLRCKPYATNELRPPCKFYTIDITQMPPPCYEPPRYAQSICYQFPVNPLPVCRQYAVPHPASSHQHRAPHRMQQPHH